MTDETAGAGQPDLAREIAACRACAGKIPYEPRPLVQLSRTAPILIASQAPGTKAHDSGLTFDDASGDRLRDWLGVSRAQFYDPANFAIAAMGFCYPGRAGSGDAPPRRECAALWRPRLTDWLGGVQLTLLVGSHAQAHYLGRGTMTEHVRAFRDHLPRYLPLPHPSWRTTLWMQRNPWFQAEVLPELRARVHALLQARRKD
jgi:uracil-DNA glycosylase